MLGLCLLSHEPYGEGDDLAEGREEAQRQRVLGAYSSATNASTAVPDIYAKGRIPQHGSGGGKWN